MRRQTRMDARRLALSAILVALMLVLLYLASFTPVLSLTLIAIAGLLPAVIVVECGIGAAVTAYCAASVLALVLVPDKSSAILFALMFGHYPVVKNLIERIRVKWLGWCVKLAVANALFLVLYFVFKNIFLQMVPEIAQLIWVALIAFNIIFVLYDLCFSKLLLFYEYRIARHFRR